MSPCLYDNDVIAHFSTQNDPVSVYRTRQPRATIDGLSPCISYWVIVTALDCSNRIKSSPELVGLFQPVQFEFLITISDTDTCRRWVVEDFHRKISDVQDSISTALENDVSCAMSVPCVANSQFTCGLSFDKTYFE